MDQVHNEIEQRLSMKISLEPSTSFYCQIGGWNELKGMFDREDVTIKIIGDESAYKIPELLGISAVTQVPVGVGDYGNITLAHVCWQTDTAELNEKVLENLKSLPLNVIRYVVFVIDDKETNEDKISKTLSKSFPDTFGNSKSTPVFATTATLSRVLDDVISESIYDLLDDLLDASKACLESSTLSLEKQNVLQEVVTDLRSLTAERPSRKSSRPKLQCVPKHIHDCLLGLKHRGIMAYSIYQDQPLICVDTETKKNDIQLIKNTLLEKGIEHRIVFSDTPLFKPHISISNGEKMHPRNPGNESYGTLGMFAIDESEYNLIALTSGHVVSEGENIYMPNNKKLGKCIFGPDKNQHLADLSVIEISEDIQPVCQPLYQELDGKTFNLTHFEGTKTDIAQNQRVFKIGATTGKTRGTIVSDIVQPGVSGEFLLIKGLHGKSFSERGDSGSVVCMKDRMPSTLIALSMVAGGELKLINPEKEKKELQDGGTTSATHDNNVSQLKNASCAFMLNEAIGKIKDKIAIDFITRNELA